MSFLFLQLESVTTASKAFCDNHSRLLTCSLVGITYIAIVVVVVAFGEAANTFSMSLWTFRIIHTYSTFLIHLTF